MSVTPSRAMYDVLKDMGVKMNEAAALLINMDFRIGGKTLGEKAADRSYLMRGIVDAQPGTLPESAFRDFNQSAQTLASRIVKGTKFADDEAGAIAFLSSDAADVMCEALDAASQSPHVFRNMATSIVKRSDVSNADKLSMLVLLYIVAGCLGDSQRAYAAVEEYSQSLLASGFRTSQPMAGPEAGTVVTSPNDQLETLWLLRRRSDSHADPTPYRLSPEPEGTIIGRNPSTPSSIDDVDDLVSAEHLRIWRDAAGRWVVEGLGSTNGTVLVSGEDRSITVVEPPVSERSGWQSVPVPILPGDTLRLAGVTEFLVIA